MKKLLLLSVVLIWSQSIAAGKPVITNNIDASYGVGVKFITNAGNKNLPRKGNSYTVTDSLPVTYELIFYTTDKSANILASNDITITKKGTYKITATRDTYIDSLRYGQLVFSVSAP